MSSFQKKINNYSIPGTKTSLRNGLLLTSTGNVSLDGILNGGLPIGSILLIEEDKYGTYSKVLSKFFIAEGAVHEHGIFLASLDDNPREFITKIPMPKPLRNTVDNVKIGEQEDAMRIAWRYNRLPKLNNEPIQNNNIAAEHYFDLNKIIDPVEINKLDILYFDGKEPIRNFSSPTCGFTNPIYLKFLQSIQDKLASDKLYEMPNNVSVIKTISPASNNGNIGSSLSCSSSITDPNILRICINSLGSPIWYDENYLNDVCRFLTVLKGLVRNYLTVTCITVPIHLLKFNNPMVIHRIRNLVDISVELESFAGSDKETNTYFKEYLGLLFITKLGAINTLAPFAQKSYDLAFKLKRKNFIIEKLHLPPELQEISNSNKIQHNDASMQCGSSTKHLLEF